MGSISSEGISGKVHEWTDLAGDRNRGKQSRMWPPPFLYQEGPLPLPFHKVERVREDTHCCTLIENFVYIASYVTGSEKTAHFVQDFKIELLVLKGRVALTQIFFVVKVMHCGVLAVSVQSFLSTIVS